MRYGKCQLEPLIGLNDRAAYLYWLHFAEGTAANSINMTVWLTVYRDDADRHQEIISAVRDSANAVFGKVEAVLATHPYLAGGEFSDAAIMMGFTRGSA